MCLSRLIHDIRSYWALFLKNTVFKTGELSQTRLSKYCNPLTSSSSTSQPDILTYFKAGYLDKSTSATGRFLKSRLYKSPFRAKESSERSLHAPLSAHTNSHQYKLIR